ncbi:hypothetical protein [Urechidicola croceus]|uniref:Uncharacterized protein n=1 Tax=Urechidicola croceus TaxID=1850246 RepID=A0A1D8P5B3_9FLAO|nr:hypothetical protein [Urechidicola croceus]AOW19721.1 hypothetical protein LPB138_03065 [Urechidicola croceus]
MRKYVLTGLFALVLNCFFAFTINSEVIQSIDSSIEIQELTDSKKIEIVKVHLAEEFKITPEEIKIIFITNDDGTVTYEVTFDHYGGERTLKGKFEDAKRTYNRVKNN